MPVPVVNIERLRAMDHSDYGQVFCACAKLSMMKDRLNVTWLSAHALIANKKKEHRHSAHQMRKSQHLTNFTLQNLVGNDKETFFE
jgi:hypothetical protein